jgi:hypothetical protein
MFCKYTPAVLKKELWQAIFYFSPDVGKSVSPEE